MAAFSGLQTVQLTMERDRRVQGSAGIDVTPEWRVEAGLGNHKLALPLDTASAFSLRENSGNAAIKYLGVEKLAAGLYFEYLWGRYLGQPTEDNFYQRTADLTATYTVSGLSRFGASLGYTQRQGQAEAMQNEAGFTGSLSYARTVSGKTSAHVDLSRQVNSYTTGANAEVDSSAGAGVTWKPLLTLAVDLGYSWTLSKFNGQGVIGAPGNINRLDHYQNTALRISYLPLPWLTVQPFLRYQDRHSNIDVDGFNDALAGLQVVVRFGSSASVEDAAIIPAAGY